MGVVIGWWREYTDENDRITIVVRSMQEVLGNELFRRAGAPAGSGQSKDVSGQQHSPRCEGTSNPDDCPAQRAKAFG